MTSESTQDILHGKSGNNNLPIVRSKFFFKKTGRKDKMLALLISDIRD